MFAVLVTLFAATALLLSGCSSSKPTEPLPDAAGLLQQAATTTKAVKSAHLELTINGKIEGLPVKSSPVT